MSEVLVEVTRGALSECLHRGDVAVVDKSGRLIAYAGDAYKVTYMRSSAKPIQAMEVILSGAAEKYNFTDKEIAIMCASHYGEPFHIKTIEGILKKIGCTEHDLLCGITYSIDIKYSLELARKNVKLNEMYNNCSGKHSGMLAICKLKGYDTSNYNNPQHPVQKAMKKVVANMCGIPEDKIIIGTDGCTVPVFGMPLYNMALSYARLANPDGLQDDYKAAAERIYNSVTALPVMTAGTGNFGCALMSAAKGRIIAKLGSDGVYCMGIKGRDIGIAIKIEDGASRALSPSAMQALQDMDVLTNDELDELKDFKIVPNINNLKNKIGEIRPSYHLTMK